MKKFLLFLLAVGAGFWGADYFGYYKFPWSTDQAAQTVQRAFGRGRRAPQRDDVIPVLTAQVRREDVPITFDAVGTVQALNTVIVRAQVDGKLLQLAFKDGQDVKKGDVLARIDPATFKAQYDQAVAKKAQDEATLANARVDLDRYSKLASGNFGSRQQSDTQKSLVSQLEAQVRLDQAQVDNAKAIFDYTTILAPIDGRTGLRAVDAGNIVHAADANGIVTITQVKPVAAIFNLPQQQLRAVNAGLARGRLAVQALDPDNVTIVDSGQVEVIDNQVDSSTGTVRIKTSFPNNEQNLWPGQFVNVRLYVDMLSQAVVVPTAAVQRGPNGAFVYVITAENKAVMTPVVVKRQDERIAVIESNLAPPMRVVTTGFAQLTDGATVSPTATDAPEAAPVAGGPTDKVAPAVGAAGERRGPTAGAQNRRGEAGAGARGAGAANGQRGARGEANAQPPPVAGPPVTTQ